MIVKKITVTPVPPLADVYHGGQFPLGDLPLEVGPGVFLADVHEQITNADYSLWARDYLSKEDVKKLQGWRYALVHYFDSEEYLTSHDEESSRALVQQVFLALRMVRPSWVPYEFLRAVIRPDGSFHPSAFSKTGARLPVPWCDTANYIREKDTELLRAVVPILLRAYDTKCLPVQRAARILEVGYTSESNDVKQLMWVTALDALFTSEAHWGSDLAARRIQHLIGHATRVYDPTDFPSYMPIPSLTVKEVLPDIYKLRNKFAHGEWVPKEFLDRPGYLGKGGTQLNYADVILEATSMILRTSLVKILKDDLLDIFRSKDALDWYFSRAKLVNKRKIFRGFRGREPSVH
jgi:hypothetical protein